MDTTWILVAGSVIGLLYGTFGVGSAFATPMLAMLGVPGMAAVVGPLPALLPGSAAGAWSYSRAGQGRLGGRPAGPGRRAAGRRSPARRPARSSAVRRSSCCRAWCCSWSGSASCVRSSTDAATVERAEPPSGERVVRGAERRARRLRLGSAGQRRWLPPRPDVPAAARPRHEPGERDQPGGGVGPHGPDARWSTWAWATSTTRVAGRLRPRARARRVRRAPAWPCTCRPIGCSERSASCWSLVAVFFLARQAGLVTV